MNTTITITQGLQMAALAPCLLMTLYLLTTKQKKLSVIPCLYFLSLGSGFMHPLMPIFVEIANESWLNVFLVFFESLLPALSYLLIFQFVLGKIPHFTYWLILAVPGIGSSVFVYGAVKTGQMCITFDACISSLLAKHLNNIVISSAIFMLLIVIISRVKSDLAINELLKKHKYWLIIALIILNLLLLVLDLNLVKGAITIAEYEFSETIIKLGFIYMVLTSIFRVFSDTFNIKGPKVPYNKIPLAKNEVELATKIEKLLNEEKVYRELGFNRASFADLLGVKEHNLSRVINMKFGKSFSELANEYRIKEAKDLLEHTDQPVTVISFDVGFSSITSFNRVFKETTNMSPSDYRAEIRRSEIKKKAANDS